MRAGKLDRRITIQRHTITHSPTGAPIATWHVLALRRPASVAPVAGAERYTGEQQIGHEQVEFQIHWSAEVAALSPKDRIVYPALTEASPLEEPPLRSIYDVLAVHEIGRNEGLQIITMRRADVT
jgi:head-tail adaptor